MPDPTCAFIKMDGHPCAARPLPGRPFCLFHDPEQQDRLAQARSKGGAAPRRSRRYPRLLDHLHVAELLSELFIAALNQTDPTDPKCLHALNQLARTLLKAVGTGRDQYREYEDRSEPTSTTDHLLRLYPPVPDHVEALLEAGPATASDAGSSVTPPAPGAHLPEDTPSAAGGSFSPAASDPSDSSDPSDPLPPTLDSEQDAEQVTNKCGTGHPATEAHDDPSLNARTPERLNAEQDANRTTTGRSGTNTPSTPTPASESQSPVPALPHPQPQFPPPAPEPPSPTTDEDSPGISSLRRVTSHPTSAAWAAPNSGCVIRDFPPGSLRG